MSAAMAQQMTTLDPQPSGFGEERSTCAARDLALTRRMEERGEKVSSAKL